jgi:hypothetical protein
MVVHAYNPNTWEAEARKLIRDQTGLPGEGLFQEKKKRKRMV